MNTSRSAWLPVFAVALALAGTPRDVDAAEQIGRSLPAATPLDEVRRLLRDGRYGDAEKAARELLAITEAAAGCESVETAEVIDQLVDSLWRGGKTKDGEALDLARRAIEAKERAVGAQDPRLVDSLIQAGCVQFERGQYAEVRQLLERALALAIETWGPDSGRVAAIHNNLGLVPGEGGPVDHVAEALRIYETREGPESVDAADVRIQLGNAAADRGDFAGAEAEYERSLHIHEKALGPRHPTVATGYHNLGYLHTDTGDYEKARAELEKALSIREETIGRAHRDTITTLGNLAIVSCKLGESCPESWERVMALSDEALGPDHDVSAGVRANYAGSIAATDPERARRLNEEAYATYSRTLGPRDARSLWVLSNLGAAALRSGDFATAERSLGQAVGGLETGAPPSVFSGALQSLAACRAEVGRTAEARALHERAIALLEKTFGPDNPDVAGALVECGASLRRTGDLVSAEAAYTRALGIREKSLGSGHPAVGDSLFALADLKAERGRLDEAMVLFRRALVIQEKARTPDDPRNAAGLRTYASCALRRGNPRAALDAAVRAESISTRALRATLAGLPERQALYVAGKTPSALGVAISAAARLGQPSSAVKALDALIRSRALVFDEMAERQRVLFRADDPDVARLLAAYVAARDRLANLAVQGEDERFPEKSRRRLERARAEKDAAERALADRSWDFRHGRLRAGAGLAEISSSLPPGSALVAFVRYEHLSASVPASGRGRPAAPVESYAAFVLGRGSRSPALVPLGPAGAIDARAASVRDAQAPRAAGLGGASGLSTATYRRAATTLRDVVWTPLEPHVAGAKTVFVVPDGSLQLINFAALPVGASSYLVEKGPVFHYLSSERDLVTAGPAKGVGLLVAGAPDFDAPPLLASIDPPATRHPAVPVTAGSLVHRGPPPSCRGFASLRFVALPATGVEVEEVADAWRRGTAASKGRPRPAGSDGAPVVLSGPAAHERAVKESSPGRRVVHLATHGFSLGDCASSAAGAKAKPWEPGVAALYAENPLLLSGLALAGANRRGAALPGVDDGILTAEEIASLDLSGVEWAVLSACETGLGEPRSGEGLFGLRRAFQVAGARTLITSLWAVEDEATRRWMKALYEKRLGGGLSTAEAVHEASLQCLRERRTAGLSPHPFYWAGFVAAGDWR